MSQDTRGPSLQYPVQSGIKPALLVVHAAKEGGMILVFRMVGGRHIGFRLEPQTWRQLLREAPRLLEPEVREP